MLRRASSRKALAIFDQADAQLAREGSPKAVHVRAAHLVGQALDGQVAFFGQAAGGVDAGVLDELRGRGVPVSLRKTRAKFRSLMLARAANAGTHRPSFRWPITSVLDGGLTSCSRLTAPRNAPPAASCETGRRRNRRRRGSWRRQRPLACEAERARPRVRVPAWQHADQRCPLQVRQGEPHQRDAAHRLGSLSTMRGLSATACSAPARLRKTRSRSRPL
jgi:hypothetical protein